MQTNKTTAYFKCFLVFKIKQFITSKTSGLSEFCVFFLIGGELDLRSLQNQDLEKKSFETLKSKYKFL